MSRTIAKDSVRTTCAGWQNIVGEPKRCPSWPIYRITGGTRVAWTCGLHLSSGVRELCEADNHHHVTVETLT